VEIDPVGRKVNFFSKEHCPGQEVYWANAWAEIAVDRRRDRRLWLDAALDGRKAEAVFDTGTPVTILQADTAEEHFGISPAPGLREQTFATLKLGPVVIRNPHLTIVKYRGSLRAEFPELRIGMDVLGQFHSYFAYDEEKIFLTTVQADLAAGRKPDPPDVAYLRKPDPRHFGFA
jgi:hypothetical protein